VRMVIPGRGCVCGVVRPILLSLPAWWGVRKFCVSRISVEYWTVDRESRVGENAGSPLVGSRVAASSWNLL
jgi:hypothetical protein